MLLLLNMNFVDNLFCGLFGESLSVVNMFCFVILLLKEVMVVLNINDFYDIVKVVFNVYVFSGFGMFSLLSICG